MRHRKPQTVGSSANMVSPVAWERDALVVGDALSIVWLVASRTEHRVKDTCIVGRRYVKPMDTFAHITTSAIYHGPRVVGVPGDLSQPATNFRNEQNPSSFAYVTQLCKQISFRYRFARHGVV